MVNIHVAYTQPINPAGVEPVLTVEQVWTGLQGKVRTPHEFVEAIAGADVLEERDGGREVVDFIRDNGAVITNTISYGESLGDTDLNMTYTFEHRDIDDAKAHEMRKKYREGARTAVDSSIKAIREKVKEGKIK
ncbi:MAG: hypothetical protein M1822_003591 [Bathelium mastoideum]|nr:MAG: hypothetical protein M1822_003591 [Bathelium mastoideum]